jgi:penicillin-binding protein activator
MRLVSHRYWNLGFAALLALLLPGCASTPKITRTEADEQIDLSGNWNDTDSRLVAEEMVRDCLSRPWVQEFVESKKEKPRVIVGTILNKSHEHIATETFVKDLERELTNSGRVRFVAAKGQREEVREERLDQAKNASMKTAKSMGQEYGADYMLQGQLNTIMDAAGKQELKYYQTELELIDMTTNEKAWIGQKKIKKLVQYKKRKF